jgi:hypothetical protein
MISTNTRVWPTILTILACGGSGLGAQLEEKKPAAADLNAAKPAVFSTGVIVDRSTTIALPAYPSMTVAAGDGRYLLLAFPQRRKVVVFDVEAAKIAHDIDTGTDQFLVAGGATRFVVVTTDTRTVARYRLETGELEKKSSYLSSAAGIEHVAMGVGSEGPLWMWDRGELDDHETPLRVVDLQSLEYRKLEIPSWDSYFEFSSYELFGLSASGDGRSICLVKYPERRFPGHPERASIYTLISDYLFVVESSIRADQKSRITYDGGSVYVRNAVKGRHLKEEKNQCGGEMGTGCYADEWSFAVERRYEEVPEPAPVSILFHKGIHGRTLAKLLLPEVPYEEPMELAAKMHFAPKFNAFTMVLTNPNRVVVKRLDVGAELHKAGGWLPTFSSAPPHVAPPGTKVTYRPKVYPSDLKSKFRLVEGPAGLTVAPEGLLEWTVPQNVGSKIHVAIEVVDSHGNRGIQGFPLDTTQHFTTLNRDGQNVDIELSGVADRIAIGGGGKYLVAAIGSKQSVVIINLIERRIVKRLATNDGNLRVAAGKSMFVVYRGGSKQLTRYDFKRYLPQTTVELDDPIDDLALGSASEGPLVTVAPHGDPMLLDLPTLREIIDSDAGPIAASADMFDHISAAADGRSYFAWESRNPRHTAVRYQLAGSRLIRDDRNSWAGNLQAFSADGSTIHTLGNRFDHEGTRLPQPTEPITTVPSLTENYSLGWSTDRTPADVDSPLRIFAGRESEPLAALEHVRPPEFPQLAGSDPLRNSRVTFVPEAAAVVTVPATSDRLRVDRVKIGDVLAAAPRSRLFVSTLPPATAKPGTRYEYRLQASSRAGNVTYRLEIGPGGMSIGADGLVAWDVPPDFKKAQSVVVKVADASGDEVTQSYQIEAASEFVVARSREIVKLKGRLRQLVVGGGGRYLVGMLDGYDEVVIVDILVGRVMKTIKIDRDPLIAAGSEEFFAYYPTKQSLTRYGLKSGGYQQTEKLKLAPVNALRMGADSQGPLLLGLAHKDRGVGEPQFVLFDRGSLRPREVEYPRNHPDGNCWNWLPSADGSRFVSFEQGRVLHIEHGHAKIKVPEPDDRTGNVLSADGSCVFGREGYGSWRGTHLGTFDKPWEGYSAALRGPLVLNYPLINQDEARKTRLRPTVHIFAPGTSRPLLTLPDVEVPMAAGEHDPESLPMKDRLFFAPHLSRIISVPLPCDRIVIQPFEFDDELSKRKGDYFFVLSPPAFEVEPRKAWNHQIETRTRRTDLTYRLESGPPGLAVSPSGMLTWGKPRGAPESAQRAGVTISDGVDRELFYEFQLTIRLKPPNTPEDLDDLIDGLSSTVIVGFLGFVAVWVGVIVLLICRAKSPAANEAGSSSSPFYSNIDTRLDETRRD